MATDIEPFYQDLGRRIFELRRKIGLTQEKLGSMLKPSATRASIANIETGKQRVLAHTLLQLARGLQVEVVDLLNIRPETTGSAGASVARELQSKLGLPSGELRRLGRELGLTEKVK